MRSFKYTPSVSKRIKNIGLYYDKFVYKEKILTEKEIMSVSKQLEKILLSYDSNRAIEERKKEIHNIKTEWIKFNFNNKKEIRYLKKKPKDIVKKTIKELYKNRVLYLEKNGGILSEHLTSLKQIREKLIESLKQNGYEVFSQVFSLRTPFLIGAGIPSLDEVGFYWGRHNSVPIIPGSSIKGAFRNYIEKESSKDRAKNIFGDQDHSSIITFLDAIPIEKPMLKKEYQTPHFTEYYMKDKFPNDIYNPVPISFVAVEKGKYRFDFVTKDKDILKNIKEDFITFLKLYGLGAKTSMGYGRFK